MRKSALRQAIVLGSALLPASVVLAQEAEEANNSTIEEIIVIGQSTTFANNVVTESMINQQSPITSILSTIDNLPGVSVQEGDTYGFDDWSTNVNMRGFQVNLDEQQIGTTIDGLPNGNSNYGGGAKANRYIDNGNMGGVEVSQGTADIASRSNEALGGTLNFLTSNPMQESNVQVNVTLGEFDAERYYVRWDTGAWGNSDTYAWFSASHQRASDWVNGAAQNRRDHFAGKLTSEFGSRSLLTYYISYDDTHEDNYQRLFSAEDFENNPTWDQLTNEWSGVPYVDQSYRRGWSTLRENFFTYLKFEGDATEGLNLSGAVYYHDNSGRGDWVPPYIVDLVDDAGGPETEIQGGDTINGGDAIGRLYFVDPNDARVDPIDGCESTITFPYGGAGPEYDPTCHDRNSVPLQSYRHTHYGKERLGLTADFSWIIGDRSGFGNELRGGLWYEDYERKEHRDWHKITDTRAGFEYDIPAYWRQYDRVYPQETTKWYLEDTLSFAGVSLTLGLKQFLVDVERQDNFGDADDAKVNSDSDVLISGGVVWETPIDGLELFAGYAENFKALGDLILERPLSDFVDLEPETAENIDLGVRWVVDRFTFAFTYYTIEFNDRIIFLSAETDSGPDYLIGTNGTYFNAGGVDSEGVELSGTVEFHESFSMYFAYTNTDATYLGTGDDLVDGAVGITPGNKVTGTPEDMFVLSLDFSRGPFYGGITGKYTGERPITLDNEWIADDYTLLDLYAGVSGDDVGGIFRGVDLRLVINNLTNESYLGGISGQGAWIGAPRTASLSLTMDF